MEYATLNNDQLKCKITLINLILIKYSYHSRAQQSALSNSAGMCETSFCMLRLRLRLSVPSLNFWYWDWDFWNWYQILRLRLRLYKIGLKNWDWYWDFCLWSQKLRLRLRPSSVSNIETDTETFNFEEEKITSYDPEHTF